MASATGPTSPIQQRAEETKRAMRAASDEGLSTPLIHAMKPVKRLTAEQYARAKERLGRTSSKRIHFKGGKWSPNSPGKKEETDKKEKEAPLTPERIKEMLGNDPDIAAQDQAGGTNSSGTMVCSYQMDIASQLEESSPPARCERIRALFRKIFCRC